MKNIHDLIEEKTTDPIENNGWAFECEFLKRLVQRCSEIDDSVDMEQVDAVLRALKSEAIFHKTETLTDTNSEK